jgi:hypothetical protein
MVLNKQEKPNKSKMLTNICKYPERNEFIIDLTAKYVKEGRSVLVISGRRGDKKSPLQGLIKNIEKYVKGVSKISLTKKTDYKEWGMSELKTAIANRKYSKEISDHIADMIDKFIATNKDEFNQELTDEDDDKKGTVKHLELMANLLKERHNIPSLIYAGGDKVDKLKQMDKLNVLFSVYPMVNEGFNCKKLNTLIMATPTNDTRQIRGRIMRQMTDEFNPLIIDIVDEFCNFINNASKRITDYKNNGYNIKKYIWDEGDISEAQKKTKKVKSISDVSKYLKDFDGKVSSDDETVDIVSKSKKKKCLID